MSYESHSMLTALGCKWQRCLCRKAPWATLAWNAAFEICLHQHMQRQAVQLHLMMGMGC